MRRLAEVYVYRLGYASVGNDPVKQAVHTVSY